MNIPVEIEQDVNIALEQTSLLGKEIGFDDLACAEMKLAVSELAKNILQHAQKGEIWIESLETPFRKGLEIKAIDNGAGIDDLDLAKKEGFTTQNNSLGLGLTVIEKSVDFFEINTNKNGTTITIKKYLPIDEDLIDIGTVCIADDHYFFNGDAYFVLNLDADRFCLGIIDGAGQGFHAHSLSKTTKKLLEQYLAQYPMPYSIELVDAALKQQELEGGVTLSLAIIEPSGISYLGVGDTHSYLRKDNEVNSLRNFEGRVGQYQFPTLSVKQISPDSSYVLIMCTDGITTSIDFDKIDWDLGAKNIAISIFNEHHKRYGDATVMVLKYNANQ